jgi:hypothetical protein
MADNSGQTTPRGSGVLHAVLAVADFVMLFGGVGESCFLSKKLPNGIKGLKTVKADTYKRRKDCHHLKRFRRRYCANSAEGDGSLPAPTRRCFARICGPGSLLHILIKDRLSNKTARRHFPSEIIAARWQITVLLPYSPPLNSLDYGTWLMKQKVSAMAHPKMDTLKQTVWQLRAAKVGQCCSEIAERSDRP